MPWYGVDPGGVSHFGVALLRRNGTFKTWCRSSVDEAINKATCFIALISDSYVASPYCLEELTQFRHRKLNDHHSQLTIFPVLSGASEQSTNHKLIRPVIDNYQYINMDVHFIDGVTALLGRIQTVLGPQFYGKIYARFAGAGS